MKEEVEKRQMLFPHMHMRSGRARSVLKLLSEGHRSLHEGASEALFTSSNHGFESRNEFWRDINIQPIEEPNILAKSKTTFAKNFC